MVRFLFGTTVAGAIALLLLVLPIPTPARAGGSVTTCDEAGLDAALAGGGSVTFNCGGTNNPATITLTSQKTITASTTIDGGNVITLSGGSSTRLFTVTSGVTLTLNAITITHGHTSGNGGCLYVNGTLVMNAITVTNCVADGENSLGGGIYANTTGRATLVNSRVVSSTAQFSGGGIYNYGTLTLDNSAVISNSSFYGGGIFNYYSSAAVTLTNVTLSGNYATSCCVPPLGGGIYNYQGRVTLNNATLSGNSAMGELSGDGGGIYTYYGTVTLNNATLSTNHAFFGGGIYSFQTMPRLTNVTLSGNSAISSGGGIYNFGPATLTNTIVANSPSGGNCGGSIGGNFNLSSDGTCGFGAGRDSVAVMLGPLANNGGSTQTHMPLPGSPAIDFGMNTGCPSTDQRGAHRPIGATCDVGAVEAGYFFLPLILK